MKDIITIKSTCCEFLENLLLSLDLNINKVIFLLKTIDIIFEPLLIIMNTEINNLDQGMEL